MQIKAITDRCAECGGVEDLHKFTFKHAELIFCDFDVSVLYHTLKEALGIKAAEFEPAPDTGSNGGKISRWRVYVCRYCPEVQNATKKGSAAILEHEMKHKQYVTRGRGHSRPIEWRSKKH